MVPEEWPISLPPAELASHAHVAGSDRLSAALTDFFLDPAQRLTELERALIGGLLDGLIGWIADHIRSELPEDELAANDVDGHALRQRLSSAGLLQRRDLMAFVMRSVDEERVSAAARMRLAEKPGLLQRLIASADGRVSAAAMDLILARGKRRDRLGQPRLDFDDVPGRLATGLVQATAAALRQASGGTGSDRHADGNLAGAAAALLGRREPEKGIGVLTCVLLEELALAAMLGEDLLESALREGDISIVVHGLAHHARIGADAAWTLLTGEGQSGAALLLRMAGVSRTFAAQLMAAIGDQIGIGDPASGIRCFDDLVEERIAGTRSWMQLDAAYRSAACALGRNG